MSRSNPNRFFVRKCVTTAVTATVAGFVLSRFVFAGRVDFAPPGNYVEALLSETWWGVLAPLFSLLVGAGLLVFLWGVMRYVFAGHNEEQRSEGSKFMMYGVIGLLVLVGVWGFVQLLFYTFGLQRADAPGSSSTMQSDDIPLLPVWGIPNPS